MKYLVVGIRMGFAVIFFATSGKAIRSIIGKDAQHNSQRAV